MSFLKSKLNAKDYIIMNEKKINIQYEDKFKTPWISIKTVKAPELGINGYDFMHEVRCEGKIISILPYRIKENGRKEFLLRKEVTPSWNPIKESLSTITGGFEKNLLDTVIMELEEEAGYKVSKEDIIDLGDIRTSKGTDTMYYLYSIDLTKHNKGEAIGDGSQLEEDAWCEWHDSIHQCEDSLAYVSYYRLLEIIG